MQSVECDQLHCEVFWLWNGPRSILGLFQARNGYGTTESYLIYVMMISIWKTVTSVDVFEMTGIEVIWT